jgi:hypothetical protein
MRFVVPAILVLVAGLHALPLLGVLGVGRLSTLYGVQVDEPNLEILMRHRAVLFGMLAVFLAACAFRPQWHRLGIVAGFVSVVSFLYLAHDVGRYNAAVTRVLQADLVALVMLFVGGALLMARRR